MARRFVLVTGAACALAVLVVIGYARFASPKPSAVMTPRVSVLPPKSNDVQRPPVGRWRLARAESLENVVLFFELILVRHERAANGQEAPFSAGQWLSLPELPKRSRVEALALARSISEQARRAPETFPALVEQYSEDELTRKDGGSPGALPASQLIEDADVLDTLATLQHGQVSDVVESGYGFLILRRASPPPYQEIAARHLVLGNDTTPWLRFHRRPGFAAVQRTRAEARALAQRIKAEIEALPQAARLDVFAARIAATSEHRDALHGGDLGVWSSQEPSSLRWQIGALAELRPGEIAGPIDTPFGTELVQRMPVTARARLGMLSIKIRFNPDAEDSQPLSKKSIVATAERLLQHVREQPERMIDWQREYCCTEPESWDEGRADGALTALVKGLAIGALADKPIVVEHNVVIARRVEPAPPPAVMFDPPAPSEPDIEYALTNTPAQRAGRYLRTLTEAVAQRVSLNESQRELIGKAHDQLADRLLGAPKEQRAAALYEAQAKLREQLGDELFERYMQAVRAEVSKLLLGRG